MAKFDYGGIFTENSSTPYEYELYEYEEDVKPENGSVTAVLIPILYSVVLVVGLLGNTLVLYVLAEKRQCWSISDIFILNLGIADVLLLLTLPLRAAQAAQHSGWCFEPAVCKISGAVFNINFYCGIFLLACISLERYLSVVHSVQLYSHKKPTLVRATFLLVWFISLILTIPDWIFLVPEKTKTQEKTMCVRKFTISSSMSETDLQLGLCLRHHIVALLCGATLIFCCSSILLRLQCSPKSLQKKRAVTILPLVVVFFVCWTPYNVTLIVDTYKNNSKESIDGLSESSLKTALMVTSALGCVHACLRPLLYLISCGNFRKWALATLRCRAGVKSKVGFKSSLWEMGVGEEALSDQSHEAQELNQMTSPEHHISQHSNDKTKTPYCDSEGS